jgi:hypothetical protein
MAKRIEVRNRIDLVRLHASSPIAVSVFLGAISGFVTRPKNCLDLPRASPLKLQGKSSCMRP